jgi:hypothetical protein
MPVSSSASISFSSRFLARKPFKYCEFPSLVIKSRELLAILSASSKWARFCSLSHCERARRAGRERAENSIQFFQEFKMESEPADSEIGYKSRPLFNILTQQMKEKKGAACLQNKQQE